jgi:hypothetical protein
MAICGNETTLTPAPLLQNRCPVEASDHNEW